MNHSSSKEVHTVIQLAAYIWTSMSLALSNIKVQDNKISLQAAFAVIQVLYSKFGFMYTELNLNEGEYLLIRENDVIGTLPKAGMHLGLDLQLW